VDVGSAARSIFIVLVGSAQSYFLLLHVCVCV